MTKPASAASAHDHAIERGGQHAERLRRRRCARLGQLLLQRRQRPPGVGREAIAHERADPIDRLRSPSAASLGARRRTARRSSSRSESARRTGAIGRRHRGRRRHAGLRAQRRHQRHQSARERRVARDRPGARRSPCAPAARSPRPARHSAPARRSCRPRGSGRSPPPRDSATGWAGGGSRRELLTGPSLTTQVSLLPRAALHRDVALGRRCRPPAPARPACVS